MNALKLFSISLGVMFALPAAGQEVSIRQEGAGGRTQGESDERLAAGQALWCALDRRGIAATVE